MSNQDTQDNQDNQDSPGANRPRNGRTHRGTNPQETGEFKPLRNILIAGPLRAGKSLIGQALSDLFVPIQTDYLILAFQRAFPQTGVGRQGASYADLCGAFFPFLSAYASELGADPKSRYLLDCAYIRPHDTLSLPHSLYTVFVGYPEVTVENKVRQIREFGQTHPDCYTNGIPDDRLEAYVTTWIEMSRSFRDECQQLNIPFFDTFSGIEACVNALRAKERLSPADLIK